MEGLWLIAAVSSHAGDGLQSNGSIGRADLAAVSGLLTGGGVEFLSI